MSSRDEPDEKLRRDLREIGRKLRKLRREDKAPSPAPPPTRKKTPPEPLHLPDLRRKRKDAPSPTPTRPPADPVDLEQAVRGTPAATPHGGRVYHIAEPITHREKRWQSVCREFAELLAADGPVASRLRKMTGRPDLSPEDIVFFDLETTGLNSTPLFLIGAMNWQDDCLVVNQYFARHYGEEPGAISLFLEDLSQRALLVSFNGKTFDWPYVLARAAATGVPAIEPPAHFDLLQEARRIWRPRVPDCKLQTLEVHILGHPARSDDIPGSEIPEAYHEYVRTGDASKMLTVLEHNYLDLVTLAELLVKLPG